MGIREFLSTIFQALEFRIRELMNSMNQIEKLIRIAYQTICNCTHVNGTSKRPYISNPNQVRSILDAMKFLNADEINLHSSIKYLKASKQSPAPVTYIKIHHNQWFSLGIFVIHPGHGIPKHDHEGMFGAIKVIHGELRVSSYTVKDSMDSTCTVLPETPVILNSNSDPVCLTPTERNIHEIEYVSSGESLTEYAAFIDFLCPPYDDTEIEDEDDDDEGPCHYYKLVGSGNEMKDNTLLQFQKIPSPLTFWTNCAPFMGKPIETLVREMEKQYSINKH